MTYKGETREKGVKRQVIVVMVVPHGDGEPSPLCRRHKAAAAVGFWAENAARCYCSWRRTATRCCWLLSWGKETARPTVEAVAVGWPVAGAEVLLVHWWRRGEERRKEKREKEE